MKVATKITKIEDTLRVQAQLIALKSELEKGKIYECVIQPFKEKRSLDANAYFHVLVAKIAEVLKCGNDETKARLNLEYGTPTHQTMLPKEANINDYYPYARWIGTTYDKKGKEWNLYLLYKQTHTLNTSEMARLIDGVVYEAQQLNIETRTPDELAKMKSLWGVA